MNHNTGSVLNGDYVRIGDVLMGDSMIKAVVLWDDVNRAYGVEIGQQREWCGLEDYLEQDESFKVVGNILKRN
jgi:hypothetical protein